ncbi:MAG: hypothetical protein ACI8WA_000048 [Polaribacter sp.]|jgi:hypothetical protein
MTQKFIPILFSTDMVNAILEGRKTQTRRTNRLNEINKNPENWKLLTTFDNPDDNNSALYTRDEKLILGFKSLSDVYLDILCPFGKKGDILWVRESFYTASNYNHWNPRLLINCNVEIFYKADIQNSSIKQPLNRGKKRPSIHMPKEACRIFLKVTNVRVERLNDISESDAIAEGVECFGKNRNGFDLYKDYRDKYPTPFFNPINSFRSLWISINGDDSWILNPFVWVIEFEKIDKPQNFI